MRICAPATAAVFFVGLALLSASMVELARWPYVHASISGVDYEPLPGDEAVTGPELVATATSLSPTLFASSFEWRSSPYLYEVVQRLVAAAAGLGVVGLLLVVLRRRVAGAAVLFGATAAGVAVLCLAALQVRLTYFMHIGHAIELPSRTRYVDSPQLLFALTGFAAAMAILVAIAWLVAQRQAGLPLARHSLLAAALGLAMIAVPFFYALGAVAEEGAWRTHPWILPDRPLWLLGLLLAGGLLLSLRRPLYVSRLVSLLFLSAGLLSLGPGLAVFHDGEVDDLHGATAYLPRGIEPVKISSCREPEPAPAILVSPELVQGGGIPLARVADGREAAEAAVSEYLRDQKEKYVVLHVAAGEPDAVGAYAEVPLNLTADRSLPLGTFQAIAVSHQRLGGRYIDVISATPSEARLWTRPAFHTHHCAVRIELADDGQPLSDFSDWPSLVAAADRVQGTFHLRVR